MPRPRSATRRSPTPTARYAAERDAAVPAGRVGRSQRAASGGTRQGVKCLHAHYAWHLAGGDDPVGRWVAATAHRAGSTSTSARPRRRSPTPATTRGSRSAPASLLATDLVDPDPPTRGAADQRHRPGDRPRRRRRAGAPARSSPPTTSTSPAPSRGTWPRSSAGGPPEGPERRRRARPGRGRLPHARHRAPRPTGSPTRGSTRHRVDTVLGDVLRRRRGHATAAAPPCSRSRRRAPDGASPVRRRPATPSRSGCSAGGSPCARSTPADFPEWSEVRRRNEAWLTPWEPRRPPKQLDPSLHRDAFVARCTARDRDSAAGVAYGFGVFVDNRLAGEVNLNSVLRGAMQSATVGYWIDQALGRSGSDRRERRRDRRLRLRAARPAPPRDLHRARATATAAG